VPTVKVKARAGSPSPEGLRSTRPAHLFSQCRICRLRALINGFMKLAHGFTNALVKSP
jgi:hypothetical protein